MVASVEVRLGARAWVHTGPHDTGLLADMQLKRCERRHRELVTDDCCCSVQMLTASPARVPPLASHGGGGETTCELPHRGHMPAIVVIIVPQSTRRSSRHGHDRVVARPCRLRHCSSLSVACAHCHVAPSGTLIIIAEIVSELVSTSSLPSCVSLRHRSLTREGRTHADEQPPEHL